MIALSLFPYKKPHFVGIGGIGMSGIARFCLGVGCDVRGTDLTSGTACRHLEKMGAKINIGHHASYVGDADVLIYSSAVGPSHPERMEAAKLGIPTLHRSQALEFFCRQKRTIAVTGTHGKTTTTSMIGLVFLKARRDPSVVVGGWVQDFGGNALLGGGDDIIIEADESDGSFLNFSPAVAVLTNIEPEHMDYYQSMNNVEKAYELFLTQTESLQAWFGCAEDPRVADLARRIKGGTLYALKRLERGYWAGQITENPEGRRGSRFTVCYGDERLGEIELRVPGRHNILNALAATAVGLNEGISFETIAEALSEFQGAGRRFDVKYESGDFLVVDDYAHHPTEIERTLEAAKSLGKKRLFALFQPHRYSRTELLMDWFAKSFSSADKLFVTDIYAASEKSRPGVTAERFCQNVREAGHPDVSYVSRDRLADECWNEMQPGDLLLVMGAGDVSKVAEQTAERLSAGAGWPNIFSGIRGKVLKEEPFSKHTSLKVGGPAEFWVEPEDLEDLMQALSICSRFGLRVIPVGAGSNLLPPDEGVRGAVFYLGAPYFKHIEIEGERIRARAGVMNSQLMVQAMDAGLGGFEFLSGIPGNIGGAVAMNAGSHGEWIGPKISSVTTVHIASRKVRMIPASELNFGYRKADLAGHLIIEAEMLFPFCDRESVQAKLDEYRDYRQKTQDLQHPSAGCMFKNPSAEGVSSGRLIDESGLKGLRVGQAQVSHKHANFIINLGGATASDVRGLMERVRSEVKLRHGIELESEVRPL